MPSFISPATRSRNHLRVCVSEGLRRFVLVPDQVLGWGVANNNNPGTSGTRDSVVANTSAAAASVCPSFTSHCPVRAGVYRLPRVKCRATAGCGGVCGAPENATCTAATLAAVTSPTASSRTVGTAAAAAAKKVLCPKN